MKTLMVALFLISSLAWAEPTVSDMARNRSYPGGVDEEDLKVQDPMPVAFRKLREKNIQKEIYKKMFNEDMKDDPNSAEEEPPQNLEDEG